MDSRKKHQQEELRNFLGTIKDPYTFELSEPITVGDHQYTSLKLRKPKGKEVRQFDPGEASRLSMSGINNLLDLAANLTNTNSDVIDELSADDSMRLAIRVLFLLSPSNKQNFLSA